MRRLWSTDELVERWSLIPEDFTLLVGRIDASKLGLAAQLAYWRCHAGFPDEEADLAPAMIAHLARQVGALQDGLWQIAGAAPQNPRGKGVKDQGVTLSPRESVLATRKPP